MKKFAIAVLAVAVFGLLLSCASEIDRRNCESKGAELGAEARLVGNRCVVKGWGSIR